MNAGRYELGEVLGVGSFATVYRAHDELLNDTVVVKMLAENHSLNPEIRERFIAEGRSLRRIASEHVVTVHDIGESSQQQPFLVLALADRSTLAERVTTLRAHNWQPSNSDVLALVRPLADALEAVHTARLVHRDLNPGNILLATKPLAGETAPSTTQLIRSDERLLLADLGMCKDLAINSGLTVAGGTAGFRPPEQARPGMVDTRADIWAATALLAWLVEGSTLPAAFHNVLQRGMHTDPGQRQQTVTQWCAEIEEALIGVGAAPTSPPPPDLVPHFRDAGTTLEDSLPTTVSGRPRITWLFSGLAVLTGAAGLMLGLLLGGDHYPSATDGASIAIDGPAEVSVGEVATFTAETEGIDSWVWALPTGTHLPDDAQTTITATKPGTNDIILRARDPNGEELEVRHRITVTE